jgi:hypothetical protein
MKNVRFYIDFGADSLKVSRNGNEYNLEKRKYSIRKGILPESQNCLAIFTDVSKDSLLHNGTYEGFAAVYFKNNSPVCVTGISPEYLRINCTRCSEEVARKLHPELLNRLDD